MGFVAFESESNDELFGEKPWIGEYLDSTPSVKNGSFFEALAIKITPKGFLIACENCLIWVWKKSSNGQNLLKVIEDLNRSDTYPTLAFKVARKQKDKFLMGFDDEKQSVYATDEDGIICLSLPEIQIPIPSNSPSSQNGSEPAPKIAPTPSAKVRGS